MKKIFYTVIIFTGILNINAQNSEDEIEVGVIEHLGETIPLDVLFQNEDNDTVSLGELINKPTLLSFVYFDCPGICSPLLSGVSDAVEDMGMELGKDFELVTISFNTRDTPEKAKIKKNNFVQNFSKENQEHWTYLTGTEENILKITDAVGFKFKAQGMDFAHPGVIIMVSPEGKITRYLYGKGTVTMFGSTGASMTFLPFDLKMAVIEAQQGIERPTINKILEYCFAYDSGSKTYALQITRIFAIIIIAIALIIFTLLLIRGRKRIPVKTA